MSPLTFGRRFLGRFGSISIFWKFALPTAALVALVALSGGVTVAMVYVQTTARLDSEMHSRVMERTRTTAAELDYLLASHEPSAAARLQALLAAPVERPARLYAYVEDAAGAVVASAGEVTPELTAQLRQRHESPSSPMDHPMATDDAHPGMGAAPTAADHESHPSLMDAQMPADPTQQGMKMAQFTLEDGREAMDTVMPLAGGGTLHTGHTLDQMRAVTAPVIAPLVGLLSIAPLVSLALIFLISRRLSSPIRELVGAAQKIQAGDYGGRVQVRSGDEIGTLAVAFNKMSAGLEEHRQLKERRQLEERFGALVKNSSDAITILDLDSTFRYASPSVQRLWGYAPQDLMGRRILELVHEADLDRAQSALIDATANPELHATVEFRLRHRSGLWLHLEAVVTNLLSDPNVAGIVVNSRDITERKRLEEQLTRQAFHDVLTGLPNRALFMDRLDQSLAQAARQSANVGVLFLDVDRFKRVNDSLGHEAGDQLLVAIAQRLSAVARAGDTVARFGGDEFTILLEDVASEARMEEVAERFLKQLAAPISIGGQETNASASIGAVFYGAGRPRAAAEDLLRNADMALYRAKEGGRARVVLFDESLDTYAVERLALESDLRHAVERGQLRLHYQPIVNLATGRITGLEALVRWDHPQRGLVPPAEFIPLAEETGEIVAIGQWVLREACARAQEWKRTLPAAPDLKVSVNLSPREFRRPDLVWQVARVLRDTELAPQDLCIEITESALMEDTPTANNAIADLKLLGVELAIDDFGTGYSSLSYLRRFPIDVLKIDRSFIDDLDGDDGRTRSLVRSFVDLGDALGLSVVAEGIETREQLLALQQIGCESGQGFLFSKPVDREAVPERSPPTPALGTPVHFPGARKSRSALPLPLAALGGLGDRRTAP